MSHHFNPRLGLIYFPLYTPISKADFTSICEGQDSAWEMLNNEAFLTAAWVNFTIAEVTQLEAWGSLTFPFSLWSHPPTETEIAIWNTSRIQAVIALGRTHVIKLVDEWYYVSHPTSPYQYYQCDTFEGLLACLTTLLPRRR